VQVQGRKAQHFLKQELLYCTKFWSNYLTTGAYVRLLQLPKYLKRFIFLQRRQPSLHYSKEHFSPFPLGFSWLPSSRSQIADVLQYAMEFEAFSSRTGGVFTFTIASCHYKENKL